MATLINFNDQQFDVYTCVNPNDSYAIQHNYNYVLTGPSHINFLSWNKEHIQSLIADETDTDIVVVWRLKTTLSINQIINP